MYATAIFPSVEYEQAFLAMLEDFDRNGPHNTEFYEPAKRHNIETPFLLENGGHLGYDVAPSERREGYGHLALRVALKEIKRLGLSRILLYTAEANMPPVPLLKGREANLSKSVSQGSIKS